MQNTISWVAMVFAGVCLLVYLALTLMPLILALKKPREATDKPPPQAKGFAPVSMKDAAELVKALASLVDSLVKAGPALWALIGSLLFLLIAATAAGVFK